MLRSRTTQAVVIGCLAALATLCALSARAADTYSIVAQSTRATAGTGRRPLAERIAAANLPIAADAAAAVEPARPEAVAAGRPAAAGVTQAAATSPARPAGPAAGQRPAAPLRMPARTAGRVSPTRR
jgi:hypothetical protein